MKPGQILSWFARKHIYSPLRRTFLFRVANMLLVNPPAQETERIQYLSIKDIAFPRQSSVNFPSYKTLLFSKDGHIGKVTLNRPDRLNAFNMDMWIEFKNLF
jgi:hypothetical protein